MSLPLAPKQLEYIIHSTAKWNIAHGSVRTGKTVANTFRFLQAAQNCPDSRIYIVGHTFDTAYRNVIRPILESPELALYRPFCSWSGKKLYFRDKVITVLGAKDKGSLATFAGMTASLIYCDEITLYDPEITEMIDTRLSTPHSMGFATCNPAHPNHIIKKWIDQGLAGDRNYYSLHWKLEDNPYVDEDYKNRIKNSLSGVFYKRNYLGEWCLAEGAIFDFFERKYHVVKRPPRNAEYHVAGIDYGTLNAFGCVLVGVSTGRYDQMGLCRWAEKEYYWDARKTNRQKTNSEYADDVQAFLEPYGVRAIYVDPSAAAFKLELRRRGMQVVDADNDVINGISVMTSAMRDNILYVSQDCPNLIREIETYVWDSKAAEKGYDKPIKKDDHLLDALRYAIHTHKPTFFDYEAHNKRQNEYMQNRFGRGF